MKKILILTVGLLCVNAYAQESVLKLSMDECVELALENNVSMKNSDLSIDMAQSLKNKVRDEYFPTIKFTAGAFVSNKPLIDIGLNDIENVELRQILQNYVSEYGGYYGVGNQIEFLENGWLAGVTATQPVYAGGRIVNGNRLANLGIEASQLQKELSARDIERQIQDNYLQIISLQQKRKTLVELQTLLNNLYVDVNSAVNAGLMNKNEIYKVKQQQNETQLNLQKVDDGLVMLNLLLCQQIGVDYQDIELTDSVVVLLPPDSCFVGIEEAVANRPESQLLGLNVRATQLQKRIQLGESLPSVAVGASYSANNLINDATTGAMVFAVVQIPISDWAKNGQELKRSTATHQMALNNEQDLTQKMCLETRQAWLVAQQSWMKIGFAETSIENNEANLKLTSDYYKSGLSTLSEMLEAQTLLQNSKSEYIDACIDYQKQLLKYRQLTR